MRKTIIQITALLTGILAFAASAEAKPTVCASIQTYSALENLKEYAKIPYDTYYGTTDEIYNRIIYSQGPCSLVVANEEKLIALLIQSGKLPSGRALPFIKAPLILWSKDKNLFMYDIRAITRKKLKSMAIPKEKLSFAGFAAKQITKRKTFPTAYLKKRIFKVDNEFQAYMLAKESKAQTAFVTKPLIMTDGQPDGSYWMIKRDYYPPIRYYIASLADEKDYESLELMNYIAGDRRSINTFERAGFEPLSRK